MTSREEHVTNRARGVGSWLFSVPTSQRSFRDMVLWWELRRIPCNLIVGSVGLISFLLFLAFIEASNKLERGEDAFEPIGLFAAPVVFNICYTFGWIAEARFGKVWSSEGELIGPKLLKYGLGVSMAAVSLPSVYWGLYLLMLKLGMVN